LEARIGDFSMTKAQEVVLKAEISKALNALISEADRRIKEKQRTFSGKMRKLAMSAFISVHDVRKQVPAFAQAIINELQTPVQKRNLNRIAQKGLKGYTDRASDAPEDTAAQLELLTQYRAESIEEFNRTAEHRIRVL